MIDKDLFALLGKNKKYIFLVVGLMLVGLFANLAFSFSICWAVEIALDGKEAITYLYPGLIALGCILIRYVVSRLKDEGKDRLGRSVKKELRERIYAKILTLGTKGADGMSMAGLTQVSMEGIEQLDLYYANYLPQFFYAMIAPFVLFGVTVGLNWRPAVALICLVPLIPASIIMVSKYAKKVFAKYWGKYTSMGDSFLDTTQGLKDLKIFRSDERAHGKMNESAEEFRKITMKVLVMQLASSTIMDTVAYGGAGVGIALTLLSLSNGTMTSIPTALFIVLVAVDFFLPMRQFGSAFHVGMNGASAGKKILALLKAEEPVWGKEATEGMDVAFEDVTFSYDGTKNALEHVNLSISKGFHALVGESGCGKSTVVNLLSGAHRAQSGAVLVGGKEISTLSRDDYYEHLSIVSYNTYIFNESILENFRLAKSDVTEEEIHSALRKVNLDSFVEGNGGIDKVITEEGGNLSGGQKQRLALAINLVADKDLYVFDEATSNIDAESEAIILENVEALSREKAVLFISHRLQNVVRADSISYMEGGKILEQGTHDELMGKQGGYASLYRAQKALEEGFKEGMTHEQIA